MSLTPKTTENRTKLKALHLISHNRAHTAKLAHRHRKRLSGHLEGLYLLQSRKCQGSGLSEFPTALWQVGISQKALCKLRDDSPKLGRKRKNHRKWKKKKKQRKRKKEKEKAGRKGWGILCKVTEFCAWCLSNYHPGRITLNFFLHFYGLFFMHMVVCTHACICVRVEGRDQHLVSIFLPLSPSSCTVVTAQHHYASLYC